MRLYKFGTVEQILAVLNAVDPDRWINERINPIIAQKFAGRELVEAGVNLQWKLASYDAIKEHLGDYPQAHVIWDMVSDRAFDALKASATVIEEV